MLQHNSDAGRIEFQVCIADQPLPGEHTALAADRQTSFLRPACYHRIAMHCLGHAVYSLYPFLCSYALNKMLVKMCSKYLFPSDSLFISIHTCIDHCVHMTTYVLALPEHGHRHGHGHRNGHGHWHRHEHGHEHMDIWAWTWTLAST